MKRNQKKLYFVRYVCRSIKFIQKLNYCIFQHYVDPSICRSVVNDHSYAQNTNLSLDEALRQIDELKKALKASKNKVSVLRRKLQRMDKSKQKLKNALKKSDLHNHGVTND